MARIRTTGNEVVVELSAAERLWSLRGQPWRRLVVGVPDEAEARALTETVGA